MTTSFLPWRLFVMSGLVTMLMICASPALAQATAATVNGETITEDEIEQRSKLDFLVKHKQPERQDVITELADDKGKIKEAEKSGVDLSSTQVDKAFAELSSRMRITPEQLTKSLEGQGIRGDTLKNRIKADMARVALARRHHSKLNGDRLTGRAEAEPYFPNCVNPVGGPSIAVQPPSTNSVLPLT